MKILAIGASYSKSSINKIFAAHVAHLLEGEVEVLDLNQFDLPIYNTDLEEAGVFPEAAKSFLRKIEWADLIVISLAEHNGSYTAAFKNLFDWTSRVKLKMFENKKMILLSTAPGARGGKGVLDAALVRFPIHGAQIIFSFSLPKFGENFDARDGILNHELRNDLELKLKLVQF